MFKDFFNHLTAERGLARNTLLAYHRDLEKLAEHLTVHDRYPAEATATDLAEFMEARVAAGDSPATVARRRAALATYFGWLHTTKAIEEDPTRGLDRPRTERRPPHLLTQEEMKRLVDADVPPREKAIVALLCHGLRVGQLTALDLGNVHLGYRYVQVCAGTPERIVPLSDEAIAALDLYIKQARPALRARVYEKALLLNYTGRRLGRQFIWKAVKEAARLAGLGKGLTAEALRQSYAAHLLEKGADVRSVQEMLGHKDSSTTVSFARSVRALKEKEVAA